MSRRKITSADTASEAEQKAALAETARCQLLREHFERLVALIDYAVHTGNDADIPALLPFAFAPAHVPPEQSRSMTAEQARERAKSTVDELQIAEIALQAVAERPGNDEGDLLLRKSKAVVREHRSLNSISTLGTELRVFEDTLREQPWTSDFRRWQPSPT